MCIDRGYYDDRSRGGYDDRYRRDDRDRYPRGISLLSWFFLFDFKNCFVGDVDRDRYERRRSPPRYRSRSPADRSPDRRRSYVLLLYAAHTRVFPWFNIDLLCE